MNGSSSLKDMAIMLNHIIAFLHGFMNLFLMVFGYSLLLGLPIGVWIISYKASKNNPQNSVNTNMNVLSYIKASLYAFITIVLATLIFVFIFQKVIGLNSNSRYIIVKVLHINSSFNNYQKS